MYTPVLLLKVRFIGDKIIKICFRDRKSVLSDRAFPGYFHLHCNKLL